MHVPLTCTWTMPFPQATLPPSFSVVEPTSSALGTSYGGASSDIHFHPSASQPPLAPSGSRMQMAHVGAQSGIHHGHRSSMVFQGLQRIFKGSNSKGSMMMPFTDLDVQER